MAREPKVLWVARATYDGCPSEEYYCAAFDTREAAEASCQAELDDLTAEIRAEDDTPPYELVWISRDGVEWIAAENFAGMVWSFRKLDYYPTEEK